MMATPAVFGHVISIIHVISVSTIIGYRVVVHFAMYFSGFRNIVFNKILTIIQVLKGKKS